ncbi:tetrapyrrole methylase family protein/MazG family protein [Thermosulfidibacter takaii ABI70S6]|uniref:Nucleoside triphosphate pyrophosphohydrolase n=1 Tax=Thermosulfidibacter takaii (strain DSM 17441 / JCM 13301 / NBRC 103674 / ABI70S6) TaxID=1298851 RepID=A0A0S3QTL0_THET7|nr:nucleoside triphosphate pyrophosphohydrolase [Thermosulfidibacter takaii]BAT71662.1 tetrapyrrole methylase family protein/MazG family protein [Thermosulfidibacter takaii ABI70S6]
MEHPFDRLVKIMHELRQKCPWDRKQTRESLKPYLIEEAYEVLDAIEKGDVEKLKEELGDLLLQVVFHAEIAKERNEFDIYDVIEFLCNKLIYRHPHVFGDVKVMDAEEVLRNWEKLKKQEKNYESSVLDGVPDQLPALIQAYRLQEKASKVGFDWENREDVEKKVEEEWQELLEAIRERDKKAIEEELGDVLFAIANLSRFLGVDPESALRGCNRRFKQRFQYIEKKLSQEGKSPEDVDLEYMDQLWEEAKEKLR